MAETNLRKIPHATIPTLPNKEVMGFTPDGVDHLEELIADLRPDLLKERGLSAYCESGDTFAMAREMDEAREGDLIIFRTAGAYGAAMSSGYNSRPLTPEVLVDEDRWPIIRRRIDLAEASGVLLPAWLARSNQNE